MKKLALVLACLFSCCQVQAWAESELAVTNVQELLAGNITPDEFLDQLEANYSEFAN